MAGVVREWFMNFLKSLFVSRPSPKKPRRARFRPSLESLEERTTPSIVYWVGVTGAAASWSTGANWEYADGTVAGVPASADTVIFTTTGTNPWARGACYVPANTTVSCRTLQGFSSFNYSLQIRDGAEIKVGDGGYWNCSGGVGSGVGDSTYWNDTGKLYIWNDGSEALPLFKFDGGSMNGGSSGGNKGYLIVGGNAEVDFGVTGSSAHNLLGTRFYLGYNDDLTIATSGPAYSKQYEDIWSYSSASISISLASSFYGRTGNIVLKDSLTVGSVSQGGHLDAAMDASQT